MGVTQRGTLVYYMRATLFGATATFGSTLQGLNQILFVICHNQTMLDGGQEAQLGSGVLDSVSMIFSFSLFQY